MDEVNLQGGERLFVFDLVAILEQFCQIGFVFWVEFDLMKAQHLKENLSLNLSWFVYSPLKQ